VTTAPRISNAMMQMLQKIEIHGRAVYLGIEIAGNVS